MRAGRQARIRKHCTDAGAAVFAVLLMIWTILPLYNMVLDSAPKFRQYPVGPDKSGI